MHFPIIAKTLRRRKIRAKLEDVTRAVSYPHIRGDCMAMFSATDCAILTKDGDIIAAKAGSSHPFDAVAPKIRALVFSAKRLALCLEQERPEIVRVRGESGIFSAYDLGPHSHFFRAAEREEPHSLLVTYTEVSPGSQNLDTAFSRVDNDMAKLVGELRALLRDT